MPTIASWFTSCLVGRSRCLFFSYLYNTVDANMSGEHIGYTFYQACFQNERKAKMVQFG